MLHLRMWDYICICTDSHQEGPEKDKDVWQKILDLDSRIVVFKLRSVMYSSQSLTWSCK